jgi:hypothetical protein
LALKFRGDETKPNIMAGLGQLASGILLGNGCGTKLTGKAN